MKYIKKATVILILTIIMITSSFTSLAFAGDIIRTIRDYHIAWNPDYGTRTFWFRVTYCGYQYSGSVDAVNDHDVLGYKTSQDAIFPPEIGNGAVQPTQINMYNGSYQLISTIYGFDIGTIRSYLVEYPLGGRHNHDNIYAADTGTNYIRVPVLFTITNWEPYTYSTYVWSYSF